MFCTNCGAKIKPGTRFCPQCGADLSAMAAATRRSLARPRSTRRT
jgi:uncharacterized membrane protein YvbJ